MLEIQADHSTLPRLSSLVTRVGTRSEREQLLASTTGLVCVTVSIGAPPGAASRALPPARGAPHPPPPAPGGTVP